MEATDGFDNRSTGVLALKCGKVILTARLHYPLEGSPKVRVELTRDHPHWFLSQVSSLRFVVVKNPKNREPTLKMIDWHKKYTVSVQRTLHLSDYALLWVSVANGLIVGLLIYHFFL